VIELKGGWMVTKFLFSSGIYYKRMSNLVSYANAINVFSIQYTNRTDEITTGTGESYGIELHAEKKGEDWNAA
jgi:hypothetical protein